jgi:hypothetical protein
MHKMPVFLLYLIRHVHQSLQIAGAQRLVTEVEELAPRQDTSNTAVKHNASTLNSASDGAAADRSSRATITTSDSEDEHVGVARSRSATTVGRRVIGSDSE